MVILPQFQPSKSVELSKTFLATCAAFVVAMVVVGIADDTRFVTPVALVRVDVSLYDYTCAC